jgi:hypothetical protein
MDTRGYSRDTLEMLEILREQRENMTPRKAKKLLKQLRIWHLLVPIEKEKKKRRSAGPKK